MGLREVKKELEDLKKKELIYHLTELYRKYSDVKQYLDFYVNPDEQKILEEFKGRVHEGFYPNRGWRLKLYRSRKAINEYKKLGVSEESTAELLLYFCEVAVKYAREKNPKSESYYLRLEKAFEKALEYQSKTEQLEAFKEKNQFLIERSAPFPWDNQEHLEMVFRSFYSE